MTAERLGEHAAILRDLKDDPVAVAKAIEESAPPGLIEAVACYDTVGLFFDERFDLAHLIVPPVPASQPGALHTLPICYALGEDLEFVASHLGLSPDEVIALHAGTEYRCYAIGFCPGFPYLGYLPEPLRGCPRMASPRLRIEPGSVAIAADQTGIYPEARPAGWRIVGRTPLQIVDLADGYFPIQAGDRIQFQPIGVDEFQRLRGQRL